jgi:hypothetical protein
VRRAHPELDDAKDVLHRAATQPHCARVLSRRACMVSKTSSCSQRLTRRSLI